MPHAPPDVSMVGGREAKLRMLTVGQTAQPLNLSKETAEKQNRGDRDLTTELNNSSGRRDRAGELENKAQTPRPGCPCD